VFSPDIGVKQNFQYVLSSLNIKVKLKIKVKIRGNVPRPYPWEALSSTLGKRRRSLRRRGKLLQFDPVPAYGTNFNA
jgi:hypothetical protein